MAQRYLSAGSLETGAMNIYDLRSDDSDSMLKYPLGRDLTLQILNN